MPFPSVPAAIAAKRTPARERAAPREHSEAPARDLPAPQVAKVTARQPSQLDGTYTGVWQSTVFSASGAAVMTVSTEGKKVRAEIALTGGNVVRDT